jgi:hypothetical protein
MDVVPWSTYAGSPKRNNIIDANYSTPLTGIDRMYSGTLRMFYVLLYSLDFVS